MSVEQSELRLRAMGVQHPQGAIIEATLEKGAAGCLSGPLDASVFDPCSVPLAPTDLMRRKARGRAVAIAVTAVLAMAILASLITGVGEDSTTGSTLTPIGRPG
ncbi:hypothetical protein [Kribbella sp. VKM Ac-2568]|uniref:hypothetical protein n=1 Tax=Kribbella sp. VKM Ac-2568 TaxID=2512219 RepID=UPI00104B91F8|nr:hypothetical protein [Kribbella sp. VKM Ac-2568]